VRRMRGPEFGGDGACNHRGGCRRGRAACVPTFDPEFYCRLSQPPCVGRKLNTSFRAVNNPTRNFSAHVIFERPTSTLRRPRRRARRRVAFRLRGHRDRRREFRIAVFSAAAAQLSRRVHFVDARAARAFDAPRAAARASARRTGRPGKNFPPTLRIPASQHPKCANCANFRRPPRVRRASRRASPPERSSAKSARGAGAARCPDDATGRIRVAIANAARCPRRPARIGCGRRKRNRPLARPVAANLEDREDQ
jgi:hypothetical protein